MARPRTFDEAEALDAAVECFWRHGLEAASIRDLAAEMGVNCPSLYNAFGDKRALFALALERYAARNLRERIRQLEAEPSAKSAIRSFMKGIIERSLADPGQRGCLIINAALEAPPGDPELCLTLAGYLQEIEAFLRGRLECARAAGEIPATIDTDAAARLFLGLVLGIRGTARTRPDRALLESMARSALAILDHPKPDGMKGTT
jgi:TetR/AcrR family transcriptional regulator, transcriptional repressor for nem operon